MFGKVKITEFAKRHFDPKSGVTKIKNFTIQEVEDYLNSMLKVGSNVMAKVMDGYAPFCKLIAVKNWTNARVGTMKIDLTNYQYLRFGYEARTLDELPVASCWFELPLPAPKAEYLIFVVYSREQCLAEYNSKPQTEPFKLDEDVQWGIVAILGQSHDEEEPMTPVTMMRNALGKEYGGSGVPLDKEKYMESVRFWKEYARVK